MIALLLLAAQPTVSSSEISVQTLSQDSVLLKLPARAAPTAVAGQARLGGLASRTCKTRRPVLGRYRFATEEGKSSFEQELICLERGHRPTLLTAGRAGEALAPSRADQKAVLAASYDYFSAKDRGRYAQAHAALSEPMKRRFPAAEWTRSAAEFNAQAGAVRGRRVVEITWYRDPEDAPEPGLYVAADFSADFEKVEFVCGYLMWRVQPDGRFRLVREEQNMAPRRPSGRAIAQIDRDPLRSRMGCKD